MTQMTGLMTMVVGVGLACLAWRWAARSIEGSSRIAIVVVLAVTAAAFNVVVPIPSVEVTTTVTLCTSLALGMRMGAATGMVAVFASSMAGGVGVWTLWQLVGGIAIAGIGAATRPLVGSAGAASGRSRLMLGFVAGVCTMSWDVITTVGGVLSAPAVLGTAEATLASALLLGSMFTLVHVACSTTLTVVGGPPLLHALERARDRLDGGQIVTSSPR